MKESSGTVAVVGLGYIGLPTAAVLATNGHQVFGVDVNPRVVEAVNRGEVPFVEPDLGVHLAGAVAQGRLSASTEVPEADAYIVAVPTPFAEDHSADLSYIEAAGRSIAPKLRGGELVILESTSPPGATRHLGEVIVGLRPDLSFDGSTDQGFLLAHCPERVLPGRVMIELVTNDRVVGGYTAQAAQAAKDLYSSFCQGEILLTDDVTAEMAKLAENAFRDVNIAFANELSAVCDRVGVNVWELIELANRHPRVNILKPGPGVGGHCIAVDPWFIVSAAPEESPLIRTARTVNDAKPHRVVAKVLAAAAAAPEAEIALLGLAFKADIDDLRESPSIDIAEMVADALPDRKVLVVEPHVDTLPASLSAFANVDLTPADEAVARAGVVALLVDHHAFGTLVDDALEGKQVIDTRGMLFAGGRHAVVDAPASSLSSR